MPGVAVEHHDVVVIGGGWSGMAAAVTLADAGVRVLVLEASDTLGGRARRIELDGMAFDNGQHLLLGAYRETLRLIHRVHRSRQGSQLYRRLPLSIDGPGPFRLRAPRLPAPLHMVAALLTARDCTLPERFALVRRFASWQRSGWRAGHADRVSALIADQPARMTERLWAPLCLAALNTPVEEASARVYLNVLRDAFAADRNASDLIIPVVDLSTLFPDAAAEAVVASGGEVRRHARARRVDANDGSAIVVTDDATLHCRAAIVATGPWQVHPLLDDQPCAADALCAIERYQYQPICTVYLRYARAVASPGPMVQLEGGPGQWLFDPGPTAAGHHHLAVVISADGAHRFITHAQLVAQVTQQLAANFPAFAGAAPVWARVITERRATHACTPDRSHPRAGELDSGIYLAGDHTDPDYPATLEAACRSGIRAANAVLARSTPGGIG